MVIRRTIRALRERPHDERRAFAVISSIVVTSILFVAWGALLVNGIQDNSPDDGESYTDAIGTSVSDQAAAAAASLNGIVESTITSDIISQIPGDIASTTDMQVPMSPELDGNNADNDVASQLRASLQP